MSAKSLTILCNSDYSGEDKLHMNRLVAASLWFFGLTGSSLLLGQGAGPSDKVSEAPKPMAVDIGGEFRAEFKSENHGLEKTTSYTPKSSTVIEVTNMKLLFSGELNRKTTFKFSIAASFASKDETLPFEYGYGTHWFSDFWGFSIGKMQVAQGGWERRYSSHKTHAASILMSNLVYREYEPMLMLHLKVKGEINLQILDDITTVDTVRRKGQWNEKQHPTFAINWTGEFGPIAPLLNVGSFDNNRSSWLDFGITYDTEGMATTLEYRMINYKYKGIDNKTGETVEGDELTTSLALSARYSVKGLFTPFIFYSNFDRKQPSDPDAGWEDRKYNSTYKKASKDASEDLYFYHFDDNGVVWAVGADLDSLGQNWHPFLAYVSREGVWEKVIDSGDTESKSETVIKLGVYAGF
jgi:hypothetical protein